MAEEKPYDVQDELALAGESAAALAVWFAQHPIPLVRVVVVARDEVHLFLDDTQYTRTSVVQLLELIGETGCDECTWEKDHLRLWWD